MNDYLREYVVYEISQLKNNANLIIRNKGLNAEKALNEVSCTTCMNKKTLWKWRDNGMAHFFNGHKYDLIHCDSCASGGFIKTISAQTDYQKGDITSIQKRIDKLIDIYNTNIKPIEDRAAIEKLKREEQQRIDNQHQLWDQNTECLWRKCIKRSIYEEATSTTLSFNLQNLAEVMFKAIRIYVGDCVALAEVVKNIVLTCESAIKKKGETEELYEITDPDKYGNSKYVVFKVKKVLEEKKQGLAGLVGFGKSKFTLEAKYFLFEPKNRAARLKCDQLVNYNVNNIMDSIDTYLVPEPEPEVLH